MHKVWGVTTFAANQTDVNNLTGRIVVNSYIDAEVTLRYPSGVNTSVGLAEFHGTAVSAYFNQTNQTILSAWLHSCNASEMWLNSSYMARYRSSPYAINQATRILADYFNRNYFSHWLFDLRNYTLGLFEIADPHIGYNPGYMSLGLTLDFLNSTFL